MRRDDDFIRNLLLEAEASDETYLIARESLNPSVAERKRRMHAVLLCDAGFLQALGVDTFRITNQGYDYLDAIRDDGIWKKTKAAASSAKGVPLSILKDLATVLLKQKIAEMTGIAI